MTATQTMPYVPEPPVLPTIEGLLRFTVKEYQQLEASGILADRRFELLDGLILEKPVPSPEHNTVIRWLITRLSSLLPEDFFLDTQMDLELPEGMPQPDGKIFRGDESTFLRNHPTAADISLVIEVSKSSLSLDRRDKGWKYAESNIPVYWNVNLVEN